MEQKRMKSQQTKIAACAEQDREGLWATLRNNRIYNSLDPTVSARFLSFTWGLFWEQFSQGVFWGHFVHWTG